MTVEERWAAHDQAVEDYGEGIRLDVGIEAMCALEEDEERTLLALLLAAHVEACQWTKLTEHTRVDGHCGDGWLCEKAKAIQKLGK